MATKHIFQTLIQLHIYSRDSSGF